MKTKSYRIKRTIIEEFTTEARSKEEARGKLLLGISPCKIRVIKEVIKLEKVK